MHSMELMPLCFDFTDEDRNTWLETFPRKTTLHNFVNSFKTNDYCMFNLPSLSNIACTRSSHQTGEANNNRPSISALELEGISFSAS